LPTWQSMPHELAARLGGQSVPSPSGNPLATSAPRRRTPDLAGKPAPQTDSPASPDQTRHASPQRNPPDQARHANRRPTCQTKRATRTGSPARQTMAGCLATQPGRPRRGTRVVARLGRQGMPLEPAAQLCGQRAPPNRRPDPPDQGATQAGSPACQTMPATQAVASVWRTERATQTAARPATPGQSVPCGLVARLARPGPATQTAACSPRRARGHRVVRVTVALGGGVAVVQVGQERVVSSAWPTQRAMWTGSPTCQAKARYAGQWSNLGRQAMPHRPAAQFSGQGLPRWRSRSPPWWPRRSDWRTPCSPPVSRRRCCRPAVRARGLIVGRRVAGLSR
jgi:hypothetical protein